uniref:Uncharacterized protein n=1 Tax=Timema genevievae TaxID=629358 RepID=A0A7R9PRM2_TIMGE|nr:unnamed protein product [Timema genevievae]
MGRFRLRRLYAAIPGSTSRDTKLRPPSEGPLVPTLLFVLPAAILGQLILLVLTPSAMALLYSHPRDCNAAAYKVLYGLERGGKGTPVRRIKLEVGRNAFKVRGSPEALTQRRNTNRFLIIDERVSTVWKDGEVHYLVASHVYPGDQASRRSNTALDKVGG